VAILAEAAALPPDAQEWEPGAGATGPDEIGMVEIGTAETGTAETGTAETGMVEIGTASGGTATDGVIQGPMLSSSVILASLGLGAGAGVLTGVTHITDMIMVMVIPMVTTATGMDIPVTDTAITVTGTVMDMATAANLVITANMALPPSRE
jgi:hypothetical protein